MTLEGSVEENYARLKYSLFAAVHQSFPSHKGRLKKQNKTVTWWNEDCCRAVTKIIKSLRYFKK